MLQIQHIPSRQDNYIWLIREGNQAIVVDPGEASPVIERLEQLNLTLTAIFVTHHHYDHVDGVQALASKYPDCIIYGPKIHIPGISMHHLVEEGDVLKIDSMNLEFRVWHTPGHTAEHVIYIGHDALFCGDTLFSGGCGRVFTGTIEQLYHSLQRLITLPDHTKVYSAHEYTMNNLRFCNHVEPNNPLLNNRIKEVSKLLQQGCPTLPSTIQHEKECNVFLRLDAPEVVYFAQNASNKYLENEIQIFAILREKKNNL